MCAFPPPSCVLISDIIIHHGSQHNTHKQNHEIGTHTQGHKHTSTNTSTKQQGRKTQTRTHTTTNDTHSRNTDGCTQLKYTHKHTNITRSKHRRKHKHTHERTTEHRQLRHTYTQLFKPVAQEATDTTNKRNPSHRTTPTQRTTILHERTNVTRPHTYTQVRHPSDVALNAITQTR